MAFAVYYRDKGDKVYRRSAEMVTAAKGRFKGSLVSKDLRFDTLEKAKENAKYYENLGCETKIKEVK